MNKFREDTFSELNLALGTGPLSSLAYSHSSNCSTADTDLSLPRRGIPKERILATAAEFTFLPRMDCHSLEIERCYRVR